jgi:PIN domain nuclease of toxin-antitoxin system
MMNKTIVLDASALLAMFNSEPGKEVVEGVLANSIMSAVNASEVIAELQKIPIPTLEAKQMVVNVVSEVAPFDLEHAYRAAILKADTRQFGLSLGDRACLALGKLKGCPVYTADKVWGELDLGVKVILIR